MILKRKLPHILFFTTCLLALLHIYITVEHGYYYYTIFFHSSYDLGLHLNAIWKMSFTNDGFNTLRGANYLGDHLWLINYLIIPVFKLFPSVITLFMLQSLALAGSSLLIFKITEHLTRSSVYSFVLSFAWLIHPALFNMNMENYHPEVIATFFLTAAILCHLKGWNIWMYLSLFVACLCKEDVALTVTAFLGLLFIKERKRQYLTGAVLSLVFFVSSLKFILPLHNDIGFFRHEPGYWFHHVATSWAKLEFYQTTFLQKHVLAYVIGLLGPVVFLCLRSPLYLVPMLPSFGINILSGIHYLASVDYHYNNQTLPYIFWASAVAFTKIKNRKALWALTALTLVSSVAFSQKMNLTKIPDLLKAASYRLFNDIQNKKRDSFEEIYRNYLSSTETVISASHNLTPNLSLRPYIYAYPNPYRRSYYGLQRNSPYYTPVDAEFIFLDKATNPEEPQTTPGHNAELIFEDHFFKLYKVNR